MGMQADFYQHTQTPFITDVIDGQLCDNREGATTINCMVSHQAGWVIMVTRMYGGLWTGPLFSGLHVT